MKRLFSLFSAVGGGVHRPALLLAVVALGNGFLGLFRDRLLAANFGASIELDMYYAAFRIPDFLFALGLLFVAGTAFIPVFIDRKNENSDSARKLLDGVFSLFSLVIVFAAVVAFFLTPFIIQYIVPGFPSEILNQVTALTRILLISPILLGLSNLVSGVLQAEKRFLVYALSPVVYNVGIIVGILVLYPAMGLQGLVWGVVLGAALHFIIQFPALIFAGFPPRPRLTIDSGIFQIIQLSFPRTIALSFHQFTFLVVTAVASTIGTGAIAIFNLAYNLQSLPLVVIGLSYSVAAFPLLSELVVKKDMRRFYLEVALAIRHIIFWTLPVIALFIALRAHIVRIVLGAGEFGWVDTRLTAASLLVFALGILGQSFILLFVRIYYALGRTREPVIYNFLGFVIVVLFAVLLRDLLTPGTFFATHVGELLRIADIYNIQILALPLAYVLGTSTNAFFLYRGIHRNEPALFREQILISLKQVTAAAIVIGVVTILLLRLTDTWFNLETVLGLLLHAGIAGIVGGFTGIGVLTLLANAELFEIWSACRTRFWKESPRAPDTEHL